MIDIIPPLKALADETRFRIINLLLTHDLCVGALAGRLGLSKAAVSQHLQILRKAGLVKGEKRGYWTHYSVDKSAIQGIAENLLKKAEGAPEFRMICHRSTDYETSTNDRKRKESAMCKDYCQYPDRLKGKPGGCTPIQIKECHGDEKDHPCVTKKEDKK
ncbi:MAG: winged helix-turn-helix transcriptional regulator [Deltaproteobacteria bacterium]|nr:winged helix-turn-helix transcriptional regulator [Deltaproteobacteria bacterium]